MYNNNKYNSHRLPLITPEMLRHQPDQACEILNKLSGGGGGEATVINEGTGNLEDIQQTTTSYDDGGVNIVTAYLSGGATSDFQIRNGRKGSQGDPGPAGQDGADGTDGFSPIATVTKSGDTATISITDQGGTTTATVSDGAQGEQGVPGPANTLSIGTVQQGVTADATITGTSPNQTLNLTLPKGDQGPAGPANSLSIGTVQQGITADATITGTPPNQVLNLSLPKGDPGTAATITAGATSTLPSGSSATVTNTGTSTAAIFDFGIPKGDTGDAATIAVGATSTLPYGSSATVTNSGTSSAAVFDFGIPQGAPGQDANVVNTFTSPSTTDAYSVDYSNTEESRLSPLMYNSNLHGDIQSNEDLNDPKFRQIGVYRCVSNAVAQTLTNRPTNYAFLMETKCLLSENPDVESVNWANVLQVVYTFTGEIYVRQVSTNGVAGVWTYYAWSRYAKEGDIKNATLTIKRNGTSVATFTANSSTAATADISVPTSFSGLSGTVSSSQIANSAVNNDKLNWANIIAMSLSSSTTVDDNVTLGTGFNYLKFGNGLMIVYGTSGVVSIANNNHYDWNTNLATAFTTYPFVIASITTDTAAGSGNMYASNNYSTKSQIRIRGFNSTGQTRKPLLSFVAFGKWK